MDRVADNAMQLWPRHPAIWYARLWSLALTGRTWAASAQLDDEVAWPELPLKVVQLLRTTVSALHAQSKADLSQVERAVACNLDAARHGPAQAVTAIIHLSALGAVDEAFDVAHGYFLRQGPLPVRLRRTAADPSVTDQHRRITQMLFIPATAALRADPRFLRLCEGIGLTDYWRDNRLHPDFARA
jgi:hypothetical protein